MGVESDPPSAIRLVENRQAGVGQCVVVTLLNLLPRLTPSIAKTSKLCCIGFCDVYL